MRRNPIKRIHKHIGVGKKKTPKWLEIITVYEPFFSLIVAILAIGISIYALNDSNKSSIENTKQLEKISKLIDKQIEITNQQLHDQILSGVPIMKIESIQISELDNFYDGFYAPKILVTFSNVGMRTANIKCSRIFSVFNHNGKIEVSYQDNACRESSCSPRSSFQSLTLPKMKIGKNDIFFIGIDVEYVDDYTETNLYNVEYYSYQAIRENRNFYICEGVQKELLFEHINKYLDNVNKVNLKQEKHIELESKTPNFKKLLYK